MSVAEQLVAPVEQVHSIEDAITQSGIDTLLSEGEYRPDVAYEYRMKRIQEELARTGVLTVISSIYMRGCQQPLSYSIRRIDAQKSNVVQLDDYR